MAEPYHSLTRNELRGFDTPSQDIILEMMADGWEGRRSVGSHVQLRNDLANGSVSPGNKHNVSYLRQLRNRGTARSVAVSAVQQPAAPAKAATSPEKFKCPRPVCNRVYASLEQLSVHINVDHEHKLKCPDCDYYGDSLRRVNLHRSKEHGYESPKKAQRLKAVAERKARVVDDAAIEAPAEVVQPAVPTVEEPPVEQAVPAETTAARVSQSLELAPIRDLTVAQLIAVAAAMGKTVEITVR